MTNNSIFLAMPRRERNDETSDEIYKPMSVDTHEEQEYLKCKFFKRSCSEAKNFYLFYSQIITGELYRPVGVLSGSYLANMPWEQVESDIHSVWVPIHCGDDPKVEGIFYTYKKLIIAIKSQHRQYKVCITLDDVAIWAKNEEIICDSMFDQIKQAITETRAPLFLLVADRLHFFDEPNYAMKTEYFLKWLMRHNIFLNELLKDEFFLKLKLESIRDNVKKPPKIWKLKRL